MNLNKLKKLKTRKGFKEQFERALKKIDNALREKPLSNR
jgi:hypothetical protein